MTWAWAFLASAWAGPRAIVAVGDGLVVEEVVSEAASGVSDAAPGADGEPPVGPGAPTVAGGWVAVLADCLEERRPHQYALLDRTAAHRSPGEARRHVSEVRELTPALVIVGVGVPGAAEREGLRADLVGLLGDLRVEGGPDVLVVGPVPQTLAVEPDADGQAAGDRRARAWNDDVSRIAAEGSAAHLDLVAGWPTAIDERAGLAAQGGQLSDQGHARVGAQVCDAVLAWESVPPAP